MSYRPAGESDYDIFLERTYLASAVLAGVGFGERRANFFHKVL